MQQVKITVEDAVDGRKTHVETRFIAVETGRRMNGAIARRILLREFPEASLFSVVQKTADGWAAQHTIKPKSDCDYHFVWRQYALTPA